MRQPKTDIPGLILSQHGNSRVAYMPADIDRRYSREHLPDHARLLANVVRWAAGDDIPLSIEGTGLIDCHLYEQPFDRLRAARVILHVVNLTSEATWRAPVDELIRVGPFKVSVRVPARIAARTCRLLVAQREQSMLIANGMAAFEIDSILDHEVIAIG
jgi:hypothetical protein